MKGRSELVSPTDFTVDEPSSTSAARFARFSLILARDIGTDRTAETILLESYTTCIAVGGPILSIPPERCLLGLAGCTRLGFLSSTRFWAHKLKGPLLFGIDLDRVRRRGWFRSTFTHSLFKTIRGVRGREARRWRATVFVISIWGGVSFPSGDGGGGEGWCGIHAQELTTLTGLYPESSPSRGSGSGFGWSH